MKSDKHWWLAGAGLISASLASLCCLGPFIAVGLGFGTFAAASWLSTWRPVFLAITFALLGAGWFFALRHRRVACATADGACAMRGNRGRASILPLALATLAAGAFTTYPFVAGLLVAAGAGAPSRGADGSTVANLQTLSLGIPSMDCEACAVGIAAALRREPGIVVVDITYATKTAVVRFDPTATDQHKIIAAIDATGFPATTATTQEPTR